MNTCQKNWCTFAPALSFVLGVFIGVFALGNTGCTSVPVDPTPRQQVAANIAEDVLANGLVLVFAKNPAYIEEGRAVVALLSVSTAVSITPESVAAILAKTKIAPDDARIIAAVVSSAWDTYQRRYAEQVSATVRPDVRLFARAVANGIERAIAAVPKTTASTDFVWPPTFYWTFNGRRNAVLTETDLRILNGASMVVTKDN